MALGELEQCKMSVFRTLMVVSKHTSMLALTVNYEISKNDVHQQLVPSVSPSCEQLSGLIDENLTSGIVELHLDVTCHSRALFSVLISVLQNRTSLKELYLYHDAFCSQDQTLSQSYERLLVSSETIEVIRFDGVLSDQMANAIGTGLCQNRSLRTLHFTVTHLSVESLVQLLIAAFKSTVTVLNISEGCCLKRTERLKPFDVEFSGSKSLFCKLFCAAAQLSPTLNFFSVNSKPFQIGKTLDLSDSSFHEIDRCDYSHLISIALKNDCVTCLRLSGRRVASLDIVLSSTTMLQELYLDDCAITDVDCKYIADNFATNNCLKVLDLRSNNITHSGADVILQSLTMNDNVTLQVLYISGNKYFSAREQLDSEILQDVATDLHKLKNKSLLKLHLGLHTSLCFDLSTRVTLSNFVSLKALTLQVKEERLLVEVLDTLANCSTLEEVNISESAAKTLSVMDAVQHLLGPSSCCNIKALDMSNCEISDNVCKFFVKGLVDNKHLERLNLSMNEICGHGILALFEVLESNTCPLIELNIASIWTNETLTIDERESATILSTNTSLRTLIVSIFPSYEFNEWFGIKLFNGLKQNTTLNTLDISENVICVGTCGIFVNMLQSNSTLLSINIFHTEFFWCDCVNNLAEAFLQCSSLKELTVDQSTEDLLHRQDEKLSQTISVVRKVDIYHNRY